MAKKYISAKNMHPKLPTTQCIVWWLFLDRIQAPSWAYGVIYTLLFIVFAANIYSICVDKAVDIFDKPKTDA